jgi:hypothetical protein
MEKKDKFYTILMAVMILVILFLAWRIGNLKVNNYDGIDELRKTIIKNDSLIKIKDGQYTKLVDYYNSEKDLKEELKKSNRDLYNTLKKQDEKILSLTTAVISLESSVNKGFGSFNPNDSNLIDLKLKYPTDDEKPFIRWSGSVNKNTAFYNGGWEFGKLPIQIVLTEEKRGLWKTDIVGPKWFKLDSLTIKSLPPEQFVQKIERDIQFLVGGMYNSNIVPMVPRSLGFGGGVSYKNKHNLIMNVSSDQSFSVGYYYKFKTFKKNK